jgi:hypothetical protein
VVWVEAARQVLGSNAGGLEDEDEAVDWQDYLPGYGLASHMIDQWTTTDG